MNETFHYFLHLFASESRVETKTSFLFSRKCEISYILTKFVFLTEIVQTFFSSRYSLCFREHFCGKLSIFLKPPRPIVPVLNIFSGKLSKKQTFSRKLSGNKYFSENVHRNKYFHHHFCKTLPKTHVINFHKVVPLLHMFLTNFAFYLRNLGKI